MEAFENTEFDNIPETPEESVPVPPQPPFENPYPGTGAGRKESPYANTPYVMNHQPAEPRFTYQQEPAYQYEPQQEAPKPKQQKKEKKQKSGIGRKILAAVLVVALVAGSCGATALLVNNHWENKTQKMTAAFNKSIQDLQKQINSTAAAAETFIESTLP